ncbi:DUF2786 domain-containing protein [Streptomyces lavendofoliae]|uniref:DUF2786 domain-containing protein n=1 Tax=Streptomyces lavendofoliae TaxID=67314 RepID=A0A918HWA5_9ACTN|nr:DUF2786 domain-containing protein [Streptomyces lavendofoliae]GGU30040.1 hypothetical protein GCM10010274_16320 [Streptomyces lavendofoliae]
MSAGHSEAGVVERAFAAALYAGDDTALDTGASLLAADPAADAELARRGEEFLRRAWQRGWQPADVVRLVRRDLDEHHVRLVAGLITAEVRAYRQLPPRWAAQVAGLGDTDWRADRFSYATAVLELYRLLARLPAIEPVGPAPGGAPPHAAPAHGEPRMLGRIRALLAKAEATGFPEEAEALTAKAQELMARYSLDEAALAARTHSPEEPGALRIGVEAPYETARAILLDAVASANRCRAVWNEAFGFSTVVGFEPDLEVVELLYTSLLVQGTGAMTKAEAEQRAAGRKRTKTFRQSFLLAYAHRLGDRLASTSERVTAGEPSLLPVLAARDVAVTDRADRMFPETTTTRVRGATDEAGWHHGTAAADRARTDHGGAPGRGRGRLPG